MVDSGAGPIPLRPAYDFPTARGGSPDTRPNAHKPYTPKSYAAQYGVPVDDIVEFLSQKSGASHGEVKTFIWREYLGDPKFRQAALRHQDYPFGEMSKGEVIEQSVQDTDKDTAIRLDTANRAGAFGDNDMPQVQAADIEAEDYRRGISRMLDENLTQEDSEDEDV